MTTLYSLTAAQNLNIEAGADTSSSKSSSSGFSATVNVGGIGVGADGSKASSNGTTYTNASINAGHDLTFTSGADTNITGANLTAENITGTVSGDLNLASVQNESSSKNSSFGVNVSTNGAFSGNVANGNANRVFTDNQTSIIGTESVDITVKNNTDIKGAVIANIDQNGVDQGNLKLTTSTLTTSDLQDSDKSKQVGISVAVSGDNKDVNGHQVGSGILGNNATGSYDSTNTQGMSLATIGQGEIITGSDISGINRDVANAQVITKKDETHVSAVVAVPEQIAQPIREGSITTANTSLDALEIANHAIADVVPTLNNNGGIWTLPDAISEGDKKVLIGQKLPGQDTPLTFDQLVLADADLLKDSKALEGITHLSMNGIMNTPQQALNNANEQLGNPKDVVIPYTPTHGLVPDLIQAGWDKFVGNTNLSGNAKINNEVLVELKTQNPEGTVFKFAGHSNGGTQLNNALDYVEKNYFKGSLVQFSGAPINSVVLNKTADNATGKEPTIQNHYGDFVGIVLGGNAKDPLQFAWSIIKIPTLFNSDLSDHSHYPCGNCGINAPPSTNNK